MRWVARCTDGEAPSHGSAIPRVVRLLLDQRGLCGPDPTGAPAVPSLEDRADPFELPDLRVAAERIARALRDAEPIYVFGDYDVDGITSAALLTRGLERMGGRVRTRVPNRLTDRYGLSRTAVEEAAAWGGSLIIAADSGTSALEEIALASRLGLDVIVADHHQPGPELPPAQALVNPWRSDSRYPFPDLSAAGVVTRLLEGLVRLGGTAGYDPREDLDLSALGTVADSVPLQGENRILVHHGLQRIRANPRPGLRALIDATRIDPSWITATDLAYQIVPRLNAAGRLGDSETALALLLSDALPECRRLAAVLQRHNEERKELLEQVVRQATAGAEADPAVASGMPLVLQGEGWHPGVLGIAAARLAERFSVPTILLTVEDGVSRGSGRTARGCDLLALVEDAAGSLRTYGGHRAAIGLTMESGRFDQFRERVLETARRTPGVVGGGERILEVDLRATLAELDFPLLDWLDRLEPFGVGNEEPVFAVRGRVAGPIRILKERHLRFDLIDKGEQRECIAFNFADRAGELRVPERTVHVAASVTRNRYRGRERLQLTVRELAIEDPFGDG
ncbi:MAG: single-stranded-DNA-specific exonuclease RecJ [Candidatus Eisenbacteria bacterium]|nr:single-stranded-DNA-specific exonuclease RecJ [Candidatus Latescibacterota bacterium]MBD3303069.1 single-stranded-DNA-specific exonuclease RecJ [Candidatus Eisenbacteria bacterium]